MVYFEDVVMVCLALVIIWLLPKKVRSVPKAHVNVSHDSNLRDCFGQFYTVAKSGFRGSALSPELAEPIAEASRLMRQGDSCPGRRLSMGLWGLSRALEHPAPEEFFDLTLGLLARSANKFTSQGYCTVMWALATLRPNTSPKFLAVFDLYLRHAEATIEEMDDSLLALVMQSVMKTWQEVPSAVRLAHAAAKRARVVSLSQINKRRLVANFRQMGVPFLAAPGQCRGLLSHRSSA